MQLKSVLLSGLFAAVAVKAAVNEPCVGEGGAAGVCVASSTCSEKGGTTVDGACPRDAADIKCCTKTSCDNGEEGNCRWESDCAGETKANLCPGPAAFKCCNSNDTGFGGYDRPTIPSVGSCKAVAVEGAQKIDDAFPGRSREIFCIRDCACSSTSSEHCCGKASDMMCADSGGAATMSGQEMAEWVMENHEDLNVKYIIWGQRIWNPSQDEKQMNWTSWRGMEDRNDVTQNHWDHVHISFN